MSEIVGDLAKWDWDQWLGAVEVTRLNYRPPKWLLRFSTVTSAPVLWWWGWKIGQVSSALPQLEEMGLLESRWEDSPGRPRRRLYRRVRVCPVHPWHRIRRLGDGEQCPLHRREP